MLLVLREPTGATAAPTDGLGGPSPLSVLTALARGRRRTNTDTGRVSAGVRRAAESRLVRRLGEAVELLAPAGIVVTPLDAGQATAVLAARVQPRHVPAALGRAGGGRRGHHHRRRQQRPERRRPRRHQVLAHPDRGATDGRAEHDPDADIDDWDYEDDDDDDDDEGARL